MKMPIKMQTPPQEQVTACSSRAAQIQAGPKRHFLLPEAWDPVRRGSDGTTHTRLHCQREHFSGPLKRLSSG